MQTVLYLTFQRGLREVHSDCTVLERFKRGSFRLYCSREV